MIGDTIRRSPDINQLSWQDEALFIRLLTVVDDYGRGDANLALLRADLCPLRLDEVSEGDIAQFIGRLLEIDMVRLYQVNDRPYLYITNFLKHQRLRSPRKTTIPRPDGTLEKRGEYQDDQSLPQDEWESKYNSRELLRIIEKQREVTKHPNNSQEIIPRARARNRKEKEREIEKEREKENNIAAVQNDGESTTVQDKTVTGTRKARPPDLLWEAIIIACGWNKDDITETMKGPMRKAHKEFRSLENPVTPGELHELARRHRERFDWPVTPMSLAKNVASLRQEGPAKRRRAGRAVDGITDNEWED